MDGRENRPESRLNFLPAPATLVSPVRHILIELIIRGTWFCFFLFLCTVLSVSHCVHILYHSYYNYYLYGVHDSSAGGAYLIG